MKSNRYVFHSNLGCDVICYYDTKQTWCVFVCVFCVCRMEVEQLQSLRSAVREELQELEQQLEDRLMEMTHHPQYRVYTHVTSQTIYKHNAGYIFTQYTHMVQAIYT